MIRLPRLIPNFDSKVTVIENGANSRRALTHGHEPRYSCGPSILAPITRLDGDRSTKVPAQCPTKRRVLSHSSVNRYRSFRGAGPHAACHRLDGGGRHVAKRGDMDAARIQRMDTDRAVHDSRFGRARRGLCLRFHVYGNAGDAVGVDEMLRS